MHFSILLQQALRQEILESNAESRSSPARYRGLPIRGINNCRFKDDMFARTSLFGTGAARIDEAMERNTKAMRACIVSMALSALQEWAGLIRGSRAGKDETRFIKTQRASPA